MSRYRLAVSTLIETAHDALTGSKRYRAVVLLGSVHPSRAPRADALEGAQRYIGQWTDDEAEAVRQKLGVLAHLASLRGGLFTLAKLGDELVRAGFGRN